MKVGIYSVRDHLVNVSFPPMNFPSDAAAERAFRSMAANPSSSVNQNPADFSIQKVGEFDPESGVFIALDQPEIVFNGVALAKG